MVRAKGGERQKLGQQEGVRGQRKVAVHGHGQSERAEWETESPAGLMALDAPAPTGGQELESEALTACFLTGCNRTPVLSPRRAFRGSDSGSHPMSGQTFVKQETAGSRWGWPRCGRQGAHRRAGGRRPLCLPTLGDRTADGLPVSLWKEIPGPASSSGWPDLFEILSAPKIFS